MSAILYHPKSLNRSSEKNEEITAKELYNLCVDVAILAHPR
jgi:hypothetical protein